MLALALIILVTSIAYYFLKLNYQYWEKRGVKGPKPSLLVGNVGRSITLQEQLGPIYTNIYNKYQDEEFVGVYRGTSPVLLVRHPDLVKEVMLKSFNSFHDNDFHIDKDSEPLLGRNPFMLKGEEWKIVRAQLTPAFSSGKMKWLYPLLERESGTLVKFIEDRLETTGGRGYDAREFCVRFTLNNVGSCAFGIDGKSLEEEDSEFRKISRDFFSPGGWTLFCFFLISLFPSVSKVLPIKIVKKSVEQKLFHMMTETLKYREQNSVIRNDFLHIISQLKKTCKDYEFTDLDITAHASSFFGDGSETSSVAMSFALYEIAANADVQKKLREEINSAFEKNNQTLPYEAMQSLSYLEAVVNESLRLHPPLQFLQKVCTENFTYTTKNGNQTVIIEKGTSVVLPVFGIQRDPKYYDDPNAFKPERFLQSNRDKLTKYTFLTFGEGPRLCLGKRFGILQIKSGIAHIVRNFELAVNKKTKVPIQYMNSALTYAEGGLWLDFKKIHL